jgi:hypothetical protein
MREQARSALARLDQHQEPGRTGQDAHYRYA